MKPIVIWVVVADVVCRVIGILAKSILPVGVVLGFAAVTIVMFPVELASAAVVFCTTVARGEDVTSISLLNLIWLGLNDSSTHEKTRLLVVPTSAYKDKVALGEDPDKVKLDGSSEILAPPGEGGVGVGVVPALVGVGVGVLVGVAAALTETDFVQVLLIPLLSTLNFTV